MKNRITAALLAFFLGGFGIHRFYLGQGGLGILHLIFCWTFIPAIISLIDAIIFLTMSDQAFDQKYNRFYAQAPQQQIVIHNIQNNAQPYTPPPAPPAPTPEQSAPPTSSQNDFV
jgi:TM2 domain-containing membrane protein YozV